MFLSNAFYDSTFLANMPRNGRIIYYLCDKLKNLELWQRLLD